MSDGTEVKVTELKSEKRAGVVTGLILGALFVMMGMCVARLAERPAIDPALVQKIEAIQKEVDALKKFKTDCDIAVPAVAQKLEGMVGAHEKLVNDLRPIITQQQFDMAVMARAMSDMIGKNQWVAMVTRARTGIESDAKGVGAPSTNVVTDVEAPAKQEDKPEIKSEKKGRK
jgi:hypothetical protein